MTTILSQKMQSDDSSARSPDVEENSSYPTGRLVSLVLMMMAIMMMQLMLLMMTTVMMMAYHCSTRKNPTLVGFCR